MSTKPEAETSRQNTSAINLSAVATLMQDVLDLAVNTLSLPSDEAFTTQALMVRLGLFRLVVMGEVKKGKSTFINALCGIPGLVPEHHDIATSTVFKIRYGRTLKYNVYFKTSEGEETRKQELTKEELHAYGTESGNPGNVKGVEFIAVEAPSPFLSTGIVIVDTPGVGGLLKSHGEITFRHAPNADAVFFVTDSAGAPLDRDEIEFLKTLRSITNKIYFIQTKADKVELSEAQARMKNNLSILREKAGFSEEDLRYFIVSSKLKLIGDAARNFDDLNESGFVPLVRFLNADVREDLNRTVAGAAFESIGKKLETILPEIAWRRQLLSASSAKERAALEAKLNAAAAHFKHWTTNGLPVLKNKFQRDAFKVIQSANADINLAFRPGGKLSESTLRRLTAMTTAKQIYAATDNLFEHARTDAASYLVEKCRAVETRLKALLTVYEDKARADVQHAVEGGKAAVQVQVDESEIGIDDAGNEVMKKLLAAKAGQSRWVNRVRSTMSGGATGSALGGAVGGAVGTIVPVVGTAIGAAVGSVVQGVFGMVSGARSALQTEVEGARHDLRNEIDRALGQMQGSATNQLNTFGDSIVQQASEALDLVVVKVSTYLDQKVQELEARRDQSNQETEALQAVQDRLEIRGNQLVKTTLALREQFGCLRD